MSETKIIVRYGLNYGKNFKECLNILEFIRKQSPDTKFELISKSTDKDKLESKIKLLESALEFTVQEMINMYSAKWSGSLADTDKFKSDLKQEVEAILNPKTSEG